MSNSNNLEIERKFLVEYPNLDTLPFNRKIDISQSYLVRVNPNIERRIRSWRENNITRYFYTEKKFLTGFTRQEVESEISKDEYYSLMSELDSSIVTIEKVRYTLDSNGLTFELDTYPFSKEYAIMEVELNSESQEYIPPKSINIIKEVTGINEYANIPLCTVRKFPIS